jgi:hypothetical protein
MRVAAGSAFAAAGSIVQMVCCIDIGERTLVSAARIADIGKTRVKSRADAPLLPETACENQARR